MRNCTKDRGAEDGQPSLALVVTALTLFVLASCTAMSRPQEEKTVTDKDAGSQVTLAPGDVLVVKLETIPGTGYGWEIADLDTTVLKPMGESKLESGEKGAPGALALQVFRIQAQKAGSILLELHYVRPWEKDLPPVKTYSIQVEVQ